MSSAKLYPPTQTGSAVSSPLPQVLRTPSGLALLELQGSINLPTDAQNRPLQGIEIGKLDFPDYLPGAEGSAWMKRAHLYVGRHQRLTGEIKELPKALAVIRRGKNRWYDSSSGAVQEQGDNLEVVEIIKYKLMFSNRPEPVGTTKTP